MKAESDATVAKRNPFSSRWMEPGAVSYLLPSGVTWDGLLKRLNENKGWGQVVGPHGHGKTTFLYELERHLRAAGEVTQRFTLRDQKATLPPGWEASTGSTVTLILVDGYEQLGFHQRYLLRRECKRRGRGLLVTTHRPIWMPILFNATSDAARYLEVFRMLMHGQPAWIEESEAMAIYRQKKGDVRQCWFALYDVWEERASSKFES